MLALLILFLSMKSKPSSIDFEEVEKDFKVRQAILPADLFSIFLTPMSTDERNALMYLYAYMPVGDLLDYDGDFFLENVKNSLSTKNEVVWGPIIPEDIFYHYVLPIRVNDESLDRFRLTYCEEIKNRVGKLSLFNAVLETNHWGRSKVTYTPADARTSAALATVRTSTGRCGEESLFIVSALRSVGIPARQIYAPRWAHVDDNHAWVEAWIEGRWYFTGACEPEPVLNLGWFNGPASRALMLVSKVFGKYKGEGKEEVIESTSVYTQVNFIGNYNPYATAKVRVIDMSSQTVGGATVEFKIYNYAEFFTVVNRTTDSNGETEITAGLGDVVVWASKEGVFGFEVVAFGKAEAEAEAEGEELAGGRGGKKKKDGKKKKKMIVTRKNEGKKKEGKEKERKKEEKEKRRGEEEEEGNSDYDFVITVQLNRKVGSVGGLPIEFDITPPDQTNIPSVPPTYTQEQADENSRKIAQEDAIRDNYTATFYTEDQARQLAEELHIDANLTVKYMLASKGNYKQIESYLRNYVANPQLPRAFALLSVVSEKDLRDTNADVLADALLHTPENDDFDDGLYVNFVLSPRVDDNELLTPYRRFFNERFSAAHRQVFFNNPHALVEWVRDNIEINNDLNPQHIPVFPIDVLRSSVVDWRSRDIFFVALARTVGLPARLDPYTRKVQYYSSSSSGNKDNNNNSSSSSSIGSNNNNANNNTSSSDGDRRKKEGRSNVNNKEVGDIDDNISSSGQWVDVYFDSNIESPATLGYLSLSYTPKETTDLPDPKYRTHFTIALLQKNGTAFTLNLDRNQSSNIDPGVDVSYSQLFLGGGGERKGSHTGPTTAPTAATAPAPAPATAPSSSSDLTPDTAPAPATATPLSAPTTVTAPATAPSIIPLPLDVGSYMLITGLRQASGAVLCRVKMFEIFEGGITNLSLEMREDENGVTVIGSFDVNTTFLPINATAEVPIASAVNSSVNSTGDKTYYILGILGVGAEPTNHALKDIAAVKAELDAWGGVVLLLFPTQGDYEKYDPSQFPPLPSKVVYGIDVGSKIQKEITDNLHLQDPDSLPLFIIADTSDEVVFVSQGYTISLGDQMLNVINKL